MTPTREQAIRSSHPSEAAIARSIREGATTRAEAIERCYQRRIAMAEREDARTKWYGTYSNAALRRDRHEQQALERAAMNLAAMQEMAA